MSEKISIQPTARWMYRCARPLDLSRWRLHFEDGTRDEVYRALRAFQNEDGGFGHALEADCWNPHSSPIATSTAIEVLYETGGQPPADIVDGIIRYLAGGDSFVDGLWLGSIPSNNDCPHAPWWTYNPEEPLSWGYNPSALLAGFALIHADKQSALYREARRIAGDALDTLLRQDGGELGMHETMCFIPLIVCLEQAGMTEEFPVARAKQEIGRRAGLLIERDTRKWATDYVCLPSYFIDSPDNFLYPDYKDLIEAELDMMLSLRRPDGVWDITWRWEGYEKEFAVSETWWKGGNAVRKTLLFKKFGKLV